MATDKHSLTDNATREIAQRLFEDVRRLSASDPGVTREAYGPGESAVFDYLSAYATSHGLATGRDHAGNLIVSLPGDGCKAPGLWCGSHLDSVPHGGNFDGLAGVVAGILCLEKMAASGQTPSAPFRVIGFRAEESAWFGKAYIGSSLALGRLEPKYLDLTHRANKKTLRECLHSIGADTQKAERGQPLMDISSISGYIELHIEQGPSLVARNTPVAVVSGIRGNVRYPEIRIAGEAGHSGAVPRELRHDAVFAFASMVKAADTIWDDMLRENRDIVVTCGIVHTDAAHEAMTRIPDNVRTCLDVRSLDHTDIEAFFERFREACLAIAQRRGVEVIFGQPQTSSPAVLSPRLIAHLTSLSRSMGLAPQPVASGAGHDAAVFANSGIESAMIFVRNRNGSHNPAEHMDVDDFLQGAQLLFRFAGEFVAETAS